MDKRLVDTYDFLQHILVSDPQISPDGTHIVFVRKQVALKNSYDRSIWIASTSEGNPRPFTTGYDDFQPRWAPDGKSIAFIRGNGKGDGQLSSIALDGGEATPLTFFPEGRFGDMRWSPDGKWLAVSFREKAEEYTYSAEARRLDLGLSEPPKVLDTLWYRCEGEGYFGDKRYALYLVDAFSGDAFQIFNSDVLGRFSFDFSPDSKQLVIAANTDPLALVHPWKDELFLLDIAKRTVKPIKGVSEGKKFNVRWSPNGNWVAFGGFQGQHRAYCPDNVELYVCDPKTGATRNLTSNYDYCFQGHLLADIGKPLALEPCYHWSADSEHLIASVGIRGGCQIVSVALKDGEVNFLTSGNFDFTLGNSQKNGQQWAVIRGSATELPEVFVGKVSQNKLELTEITRFNRAWLDAVELSEPQEHWITSADGTKIQAWIVRPPRLESHEVTPAIIDIHGGPHAFYGYGYLHDVQVLAGQGYTIIYCNPRGSKGYGRAFSLPLKEKYGGKDWDDIQAVIAFMQTHEGIDSQRLGVIGASYGGYMANWAIAHTDAFSAAVTDRSICNLISQFGTSDLPRLPEQNFNASPWHHPEQLWEQSPLKHVANVKTPTLIVHGEGDTRVGIEQAEQWFTSLRLLGVATRFLRYPKNATHEMARAGPPDLRLHRLEQIIMWFDTYLVS